MLEGSWLRIKKRMATREEELQRFTQDTGTFIVECKIRKQHNIQFIIVVPCEGQSAAKIAQKITKRGHF